MSRASNTRQVRIQAVGPFFDLDFTVPEKKAAAELRKLKRIQNAAIRPLINRWKHENSRQEYKVRRRGYVTVRPRMTEDIAQSLGIQPTTIITTVI
jgi:hypothetical protein